MRRLSFFSGYRSCSISRIIPRSIRFYNGTNFRTKIEIDRNVSNDPSPSPPLMSSQINSSITSEPNLLRGENCRETCPRSTTGSTPVLIGADPRTRSSGTRALGEAAMARSHLLAPLRLRTRRFLRIFSSSTRGDASKRSKKISSKFEVRSLKQKLNLKVLCRFEN